MNLSSKPHRANLGIAIMFSATLFGALLTTNAFAEEHIVKGVITQWQPLVTFAQPGDTVKFTGMTGHDTASMEGLLPEGAEPWHSKLGEEGFTITVDKEGAYVYKCTPHITTGMVGVIVVGDGDPANLAEIEENAKNVKIGGNMVKRALRKTKKQLEKRAAGG